jgi:MFS family permease
LDAAETSGRQPERWLVITTLGVTQILAWGSTFYLPAVAARPIVADTGWPLPLVVGGLSVGLLVAGLVSPSVGRMIHRRGGRPVLAASSAIFGLGLVCLGLAPSLFAYFAAWVIIGVGMGAGLYDAAFATLGQSYGAAGRRAITSLTLIAGFSSTIMWPAGAWLIDHAGWRNTCLIYAAIQILVALPLHLLLMPDRTRIPAGPTEEDRTVGKPSSVLPRGGSSVFLVLAVALSLGGVVAAVLSVHLIAMVQGLGLDLVAATALAALIGPSQVVARIGELALARMHHPLWTLVFAMGLITTGFALLLGPAGWIAVGIVLYGAGNGIQSIARGTVPLALFGPANYAALMGRLGFPNLIAQALSPTLAAILLADGDERMLLAILTGIAGASLLLAILLLIKAGAAPASR